MEALYINLNKKGTEQVISKITSQGVLLNNKERPSSRGRHNLQK
jgi:hypothetical protein